MEPMVGKTFVLVDTGEPYPATFRCQQCALKVVHIILIQLWFFFLPKEYEFFVPTDASV